MSALLSLLARGRAVAPLSHARHLGGGIGRATLRPLSALAVPAASRDRLRAPVGASVTVSLKPGDRLHGYTVERVQAVPSLFLTAVLLTHDRTGAQHLHIARADPNNVFSVAFRTPPTDSTGVAHILEHTVLCGSAAYPTRDPFFAMTDRSMATYMNAWTSLDYTQYPFATQNAQDFNNLLSVYLDAAFFPLLKEADFRQEGWRLEHETPDDPSTPIVFKGVVFNEMKGALAENDARFSLAMQQQLLAGTPYAHVSGGEPLAIPDLTWAALRDFHLRHYHPSNAVFMTYGDIPVENHLRQIASHALDRFRRRPVSATPDQLRVTRWSQPRQHTVFCPPDPHAARPDRQAKAAVAFLTGPRSDPFETLCMQVIAWLLTSGNGSPLYNALIRPDIGEDYAPGTGFHSHSADSFFAAGLSGVRDADAPRVEAAVREVLEKCASVRFDRRRVDSALQQMEIGVRHQSASMGISLAASVVGPWLGGADPIELLDVDASIARFRSAVEDDMFLPRLLRRTLVDNPHALSLTMVPDAGYSARQADAEAAILARRVQALSDADKQRVLSDGIALSESQKAPRNAECLPRLTLGDVDRVSQFTAVDHVGLQGVPVQVCVQPTNGMVYFRAVASVDAVPPELRVYLPLFASVLTRLGADTMDDATLSNQMQLVTGGMSADVHLVQSPHDARQFEHGISFHSNCLGRNTASMFSLWVALFTSAHLRNTRVLHTIAKTIASRYASSLVDDSSHYAAQFASRGLSSYHATAELMGGLTQAEFSRQLLSRDFDGVADRMVEIAKHVLVRPTLRCSINADGPFRGAAELCLSKFLAEVDGRAPGVAHPPLAPSPAPRSAFGLPTGGINGVALAVPTVPYMHVDAMALRVLASVMTSKRLHIDVRESGGAYGGGASHGAATFIFHSYRDPRTAETIDVFKRAAEWAAAEKFTDGDVDDAKLAVFKVLDAPVSPGARGSTLFTHGITHAMRQLQRERLFAVRRSDVGAAARKYLLAGMDAGAAAVVGDEGAVAELGKTGWAVGLGSALEGLSLPPPSKA